VGITHFEDAPVREFAIGHIAGRWSGLGEAAGSAQIGVRRLELPVGSWSTPAHEHGREEEIFYVLSGRGLSWQAGTTAEVGPGDCILYLPNRGAHTLHAIEPLDVLAFGPREHDEAVGFPRLAISLVGRRAVASEPGAIDHVPIQFVHESELGPPDLPDEPGPRPATVVNVDDVEGLSWGHGSVETVRRNVGEAVGSSATGIKHIVVAPGKESAPPHCHSVEEELFVVLEGAGFLLLGDDEHPVRAGSVVARTPGTGVAHAFRAGSEGLTLLAYGTRDPGDMCYYPRSNKVSFRGLGVMARLEPLEYWDGEE
jgi:uncharacterized cupin superfamily protein